ncbi:MAG: caspase family protein [Nitrospinae bacterium]|nr:caspase family protein [Nitrospinota bacterium]
MDKITLKIGLVFLAAAFLASCTAKSIPKVHMKGSDATMAMELTKPAHGLTAIAISKDGSYVLTADNGGAGGMGMMSAESTIRLWDISSGKLVRMIKADSWINHLEFSPDGKYAALAGYAGYSTHSLKLLDMSSGKLVWESSPPAGFSTSAVSGYHPLLERATFSPDGKYVLAPGNPATMIEVSTGKTVKATEATFFTKGYVSRALFSPDGRYILTGDTWFEEFKLLDAKTFKEIRRFKGHKTSFTIATSNFVPKSLSFSPDGRYAMSSIANADAVIIWDIETGKEIRRFEGFENISLGFRVVSASFSPDGKSALIQGSSTKIWDIASGEEKKTILNKWDIQVTGNPPNGASFNPNGGNLVLSFGDSGVRVIDVATAKETAMLVGFEDGEWIIITPEGHYNSSEKGAQYLSVKVGERKYDTNLFYDVFYRPDIVAAKLRGEDIQGLVTITMQDAIKSPPPIVEFTNTISDPGAPKVKVCFKAKSAGGGVGEVRLFHNGKLVQSDGYYKDVARASSGNVQLQAMNSKAIYEDMRGVTIKEKAVLSPIASKDKGDVFEDCGEIDAVSGGNEVSVTAFNANNTVQSQMNTISFTSKVPAVEPHLYILSIGIDQYKDGSVNLKYAVKDATDIKEKILRQAATLYKPKNIHLELLADQNATKANILNTVNELSAKIKPSDSFILFAAGHGVLLQNQYFMLTHAYAGEVNDSILISANEIVEMSKKIKSLSQLLIFDTCHAGGVDYIVSGLYDARMSVLAKKMGLHIYASASSLQEALDGYEGNGLFSHALLDGLNNNRGADANADGNVSLVELGEHSKMTTVELSKKAGHIQTPLIINFGKDSPIYTLGR